ncbi:MAG TPA: group III truncated hemoglobin [Thermomicrobiales bacterium]|nr:group III truncated hemoglobin [Thermomicrobiales bacterium]
MSDPAALTDIRDRDDIAELVVAFYTSAFADEQLGPIFTDIVKLDLDAHLPYICDFWETVVFQAGLYRRDSLAIHRDVNDLVPLTKEHFQRWEDLWHETVDARFAGPRAIVAKVHASRMAVSMQNRLKLGVVERLIQIGPFPFPQDR